MADNRLTFTLIDVGYKKGGPVQIFDERTCYDGIVNDDGDPVIIPFSAQLAIVSHALMLKGKKQGDIYQSKAKQLVDAWTNVALPGKGKPAGSTVAEPTTNP